MQRTYILALVGMLSLTTCSKLQEKEKRVQMLCTVQIQIQTSQEILPFKPTRSIPGNIPSEPGSSTPDSDEEMLKLFNTIEYTVYNTGTDEMIKREQRKDNDGNNDFGNYLYDNFAPGDYIISILAHSAPKVSNKGDCITFDQVGDCFYTSYNLTIEPGVANHTVELTLKRIVSRVEFQPTDSVPANATSFCMKVSGLYNTFNLLTGEAEATTKEVTMSHTFTSSDRHPTYKPSFITLLPSNGTKIGSVTLQTLKEEEPLNTQTIKDIPLYFNRTTRYTGALFTSSLILGTFKFIIENEGKWEDDFEYNPTK